MPPGERMRDRLTLMRVQLHDAACFERRTQSRIECVGEGHVLSGDSWKTTNRSDAKIGSVGPIWQAIGSESLERRVERAVAADSRRKRMGRGRQIAHRVAIVPAVGGAIKRRKQSKTGNETDRVPWF